MFLVTNENMGLCLYIYLAPKLEVFFVGKKDLVQSLYFSIYKIAYTNSNVKLIPTKTEMGEKTLGGCLVT